MAFDFHGLMFAFLLCSSILLAPAQALAGNAYDGFAQIYNVFFGSQSARDQALTCDVDLNTGGILTKVNAFFCHLEKDMGITSSNVEVTKTFGNLVVHAKVDGAEGGAAYAVDGVNYDYQAQVWVCLLSQAACSATTDFNRAIYIAYSYKADKTVNKGHMLMSTRAFHGESTSGMMLKYDVGDNTATKTVEFKLRHTEDGDTIKIAAKGTKTSAQTQVAMVIHSALSASYGFRFASTVDETNNIGAVYYEAPPTVCTGTGCGSLSMTNAGDTQAVSSGACFTRARTATDWAYTPAAADVCSGLSFPAFPNQSVNTVSGFTITATDAAGVLVPAPGGTIFNGMATNPSAL
ncbi:MAG: hypothetical protein HYW49_06315 [Deltaproteobacteria bacterium]|nr:hypothetical protein [Deltaproteobacteria bacterium]